MPVGFPYAWDARRSLILAGAVSPGATAQGGSHGAASLHPAQPGPPPCVVHDTRFLSRMRNASRPETATLPEDEARALLRSHGALSPIDAWIAEQLWLEVPGGWHVGPARDGWRFEIRSIPEGLQIRGHAYGRGAPAIHVVPKARIPAP